MRRLLCLVCTFLLIYNMGIPVNADELYKTETASDLFQLYNDAELALQLQLNNEYHKAVEEYNSVQSDVEMGVALNAALSSADAYRETRRSEIEGKMSNILGENVKLISSIEENIDSDWDSLFKQDLQIKANQREIEELLLEEKKYVPTTKVDIDFEKLEQLEQEVNELQTVYKESVEVSHLGQVKGVRYPLNADTVVTSPYGNRIDPMTGTSIRFHAGIDLRAKVGTEVISIFNGVVIGTGYSYAGGNYVRVDHGNGIISFYCHLSEILCEVGDVVNQYDVIALSGNTGARTTGPHLHFALYIKGNSVDPGVLYAR